MRRLRSLLRLIHCQRGVAAIEMAFVLPAFLTFCLGTMEFGRMFWVRSSLQFAAEEAARYALAHPSVGDAYLNDLALARFGEVAYGSLNVTVTRETVSGDAFLIIDATYDFEFMLTFVPLEPVTLEGRSRVPLS